MADRRYRMSKRAKAVDETRDRIVAATLTLHMEKGVVATSHSDIADRAGVGAATVYRHFPSLDTLVEACGARVQEMVRAPLPAEAPAVFAGLVGRRARLERLVAELGDLYTRGAPAFVAAQRDRDRVPQLDASLRRLEAGVEALVREAVGLDTPEPRLRLVIGLASLGTWQSMTRLGVTPAEILQAMECALGEAGSA